MHGGIENQISQGIVPFDSYYYRYLGRSVRIPGEECDTIKVDTTARHVLVLKYVSCCLKFGRS